MQLILFLMSTADQITSETQICYPINYPLITVAVKTYFEEIAGR